MPENAEHGTISTRGEEAYLASKYRCTTFNLGLSIIKTNRGDFQNNPSFITVHYLLDPISLHHIIPTFFRCIAMVAKCKNCADQNSSNIHKLFHRFGFSACLSNPRLHSKNSSTQKPKTTNVGTYYSRCPYLSLAAAAQHPHLSPHPSSKTTKIIKQTILLLFTFNIWISIYININYGTPPNGTADLAMLNVL